MYPQSASGQKIVGVFDAISYILVLINAFLVALFIDPKVYNFYVIPKEYVFIGINLLSVLLIAARIVLSRKVSIKRSVLDWPVLVMLVLGLLSSLFSGSMNDSFLGRSDFFAMNFVFMAFLGIFYFVIINTVSTPDRWKWLVDAIVGTGGVSALLFILKAVFKLQLPWIGSVWNLVDATNSSFGLWLAVIFILCAGLIIKKNLGVSRALFYFFVMIVSFVPLLIMGFKFLWWVLLIGLILLLLLGASFIKDVRVGWLSVLFSALILVCVFIIFGSPKSLQSVLPVEVSLGSGSSWSVTKASLFNGAKTFLFGSGLGTFAFDFSKYRTADFNNDQVAWSLRFNQPYNSIYAILSEGGLLLLLAFVFLALFVIGHSLNGLLKNRFAEDGISAGLRLGRINMRLDVLIALICWLVMWVGMFVGFFGPALWAYWMLFLGLIVSGLAIANPGIVREKTWTLEDTPQYNLAFSFSLIIVMAVFVMLGILGIRFYWADVVYAKALTSRDFESAQSHLGKALTLHQKSDVYHVALARVYLLKASELSRVQPPDVQSIAAYVAQAVNEAKLATDLSPKNVAIWENLATMYENASLLVPEANQWAVKSLATALELEPTNAALYWRLGNNYLMASNNAKSIENYKKAIDLKQDYVGAYVSLSGAYEADKQINEAVETYKKILPYGANNPEVLYNFGRLLYNRNEKDDRANAEQLWLKSISLQPNYSNALYSLGLLYESKNDRAKALQYYYKVKDLNPENTDIVAKIKSLVGGKTTLGEERPVSNETTPANP